MSFRYRLMLSAKKASMPPAFLIQICFSSLSCLMALAKTLNTVLSRAHEGSTLVFLLTLEEKISVFSI